MTTENFGNKSYDHLFLNTFETDLIDNFNIKKDLKEKILSNSKTFTVVAGAPKISTRIVSIIGNNKGIIGLGVGRSVDRIKAHELAFYNGKKKLMYVPLTKNFSIPLYTWARFCSSSIKLYPTFCNSGLKIGGPAKTILQLAGLKNITAVKMGSANIFNTANAVLLAINLLSKKIELLVKQNIYYKNFFRINLLNYNRFFK